MSLPPGCDHTGFCRACSTLNHMPCAKTASPHCDGTGQCLKCMMLNPGEDSPCKGMNMAPAMTSTATSAEPKPSKPDGYFKVLHDMLSMMRPHGSRTEERFIDKYIKPLGAKPDKFGNMILQIGTEPILWSSHLDTVHHYGGIQPLQVDNKGLIEVPSYSLANCLGADDTAGVWVMVNLAIARKPGLYIFHRAEECGGRGSKWIAENTPDLLHGIKFAVALDRKGKDSIITHQWGTRCCSESFSKSLAAELGMGMKSDNGGSFTDTANYIGLVPECTNLSVGYQSQHSAREELDQNFLAWLLERLMVFNVDNLVAERKAGEKEYKTYNNNNGGGTHFRGKGHNKKNNKLRDETHWRFRGNLLVVDSILSLVEDYPEEIAKMLEESNYSIAFLRNVIRRHGGVIEDGDEVWGHG